MMKCSTIFKSSSCSLMWSIIKPALLSQWCLHFVGQLKWVLQSWTFTDFFDFRSTQVLLTLDFVTLECSRVILLCQSEDCTLYFSIAYLKQWSQGAKGVQAKSLKHTMMTKCNIVTSKIKADSDNKWDIWKHRNF